MISKKCYLDCDNVKRLMEQQGFEARTLGLSAGLSYPTVLDAVKGKACSYKTVLSIAKALKVSAGEIVSLGKDESGSSKCAPAQQSVKTVRAQVLAQATDAVCGNREQDYGTPENNFSMIAELWSVYLGKDVSAQDVAMMMVLLKTARIKSGTATEDSFVDIAGYAACGAEIEESKKRSEDVERE